MADRFSRTKKCPTQVDSEHPVKIVEIDVLACRDLLNPGVIHEHIKRSEGVYDLREHPANFLLPGDIRLDQKTTETVRRGTPDHLFRRGSLIGTAPVINRYVGALLGETDRNRLADASGRAGN